MNNTRMALATYDKKNKLYKSNNWLEKLKREDSGFLSEFWNTLIEEMVHSNQLFIECTSTTLTFISIESKSRHIIKNLISQCIKFREYGIQVIVKQNIGQDAMGFNFKDNAIYIETSLSLYRTMTVYAENSSSDTKTNICVDTGKRVTMCLYEDGTLLLNRSENTGYYSPSMEYIKNFSTHFFNNLVIRAYLKSMSKRYPLYKDILRDYNSNPEQLDCKLPLSEASKYFSFQTWIQGHYKTCKKIPKCVNKMCLNEAVVKALFCKNVNENEQMKIYQLKNRTKSDSFNTYSVLTERKLIISYYLDVLSQDFLYKDVVMSMKEKEDILMDYYNMTKALRSTLDLNLKSFRGILNRHNELVPSYMNLMAKRAGTRKMTIPKESPFRKLNLPDNWELIKTGKRLFIEGNQMHHCVYTYLPYVNKGKCCIVHLTYNEIPYTAEIRVKRKQYKCVQLYGKYDVPAPKEVWEYVSNILSK